MIDLDKIEMVKIEDCEQDQNIPYATHEGILEFNGVKIRVVQLSNGERVIPEDDFMELLKWFDQI